jgi:heat shock protein HslJ
MPVSTGVSSDAPVWNRCQAAIVPLDGYKQTVRTSKEYTLNKQMQLLPIFALVAALLFAVAPFVGAQAAGLPALQQDATAEPTAEATVEATVESTADATPEATAEATIEATPAADAAAAVAATSEQTITVEDLSNMTYMSFISPTGVVTLTNGTYEDTENRITAGIGTTPTVAYGTIDSQNAAAVIIGESGGGSGQFVNLALVMNVDGTPTNVATVQLGDRVGIEGLTITESGLVVVDMVAQGPNDPMCCPTMPVTRIYAYTGDAYKQLAPVAEVAGTINGAPVTQQVLAAIIAATPYDNSMPPGAQGQPKHPVWSLDLSDPQTVMNTGGAYVAIYNVAAWEAMWNAAGDNYVSDAIAQLNMLLQEKPAELSKAPAILPEPPAMDDIVAQVAYLDLPDGGSGVRWVGRLTQDASPIRAEGSLRYFFQGLTSDGQRVIVSQAPLAIPADTAGVYTDTITAEQMDQLTANWDKYIADLTTTLNELPSDAYSPTLTALDQVMESVTVSQSVNTLLPGVLGNLAYTLTLTNEPAQFVDGKYEDSEAQINASLSVLNPIAYGYLNDVWTAAVLIGENGGGSGVFTTLNVVQDVNGAPTPVAMTLLGDRVQVHSVTIAGANIELDMTTQGPNDPMCCPTMRVIQVYTLENGELKLTEETPVTPAPGVEAGSTMTGTEEMTSTEAMTGTEPMTGTEAMTDTAAAGANELAGTTWVWTQTQMNDGTVITPAQADAFQLKLGEDGSAGTTTDCNTFRGTYTVDGNKVKIDLPISTRMACPDGSQEAAYIKHLTSVQSYLMADGNLVLELPFDSGGMTFAPAK